MDIHRALLPNVLVTVLSVQSGLREIHLRLHGEKTKERPTMGFAYRHIPLTSHPLVNLSSSPVAHVFRCLHRQVKPARHVRVQGG